MDVPCVQQILRLYGKEHKIVFHPWGEFRDQRGLRSPACRDCTDLAKKYALIDSGRTQTGEALATDRQGFVEACSRLKIPCRVLERRAIENYLPTQNRAQFG